jgi:hypothetical protein
MKSRATRRVSSLRTEQVRHVPSFKFIRQKILPKTKPTVKLPKISLHTIRRVAKTSTIRPGRPKTPPTVVSQQVVPRGTKFRRNKLRIALQPKECRIRKAYKKQMLKKLAAQVTKRGGRSALSNWRVKRRQQTNIQYRC